MTIGDATITTLSKRSPYLFIAWRHVEWTKYHVVQRTDMSRTMCGATPYKGNEIKETLRVTFKDLCGNCVANIRRLL